MRVRKTWVYGWALLAVTGCSFDPYGALGTIELKNPDDGPYCLAPCGGSPWLDWRSVFIDVRDSANAPVGLPAGDLYCIREGYADTTTAVASVDTSVAP